MCNLLNSIVVSIPACHAGDQGSIPRFSILVFFSYFYITFCEDTTEYLTSNYL